MCGIVGILNKSMPVDRSVLERMNDRIVHRGPDEDGIFWEGTIGLAMRRLKVIDLEGGRQPIENEDGTCRIVYNGEVYNYRSLRRRLESKGHRFSSSTDTESVLHLYEDVGDSCVDDLNGMFAFAIHNERDGSVLLARDRLGIKPLYYAETDDGLVFGSEIKAILAHPGVDREIDPQAVDQYLTYRFVLAPRTIYRSIRKLPPGHTLRWQAGTYRVSPYWHLDYLPKHTASDRDLEEEFEERFDAAVASQMISDVPLGAFLSGGLDSTLIVSSMTRAASMPVETFSIGFDDASFNELSHARVVAEHFGTKHHELVVNPDACDLFDRVVGQFDEPFGDSSAIPTYLVSRLAREHVTVALSGTGADELFAGYERYWSVPLSRPYQMIPGPARDLLGRLAAWLPTGHAKRGFISRAARFMRAQTGDTLTRHLGIVRMLDQTAKTDLYTSSFQSQLSEHDEEAFRRLLDPKRSIHPLDQMLSIDTRTILPDDYLTKDDRMSMAHSLEVRVPFLDHTLVEFAAACPPQVKLKRLKTKVLMRRVASGRIPEQILNRPKHGFEIPISKWIAQDLSTRVDELLRPESASYRQYLSANFVQELLDRHRTGRMNHGREIWSLMVFEMWLQSENNTSTAHSRR